MGNEQSADYMVSLIGPRTKKIYLAHLSEECNRPDLALDAYRKAFAENGIAFKMEDVIPLKQWERVSGGGE